MSVNVSHSIDALPYFFLITLTAKYTLACKLKTDVRTETIKVNRVPWMNRIEVYAKNTLDLNVCTFRRQYLTFWFGICTHTPKTECTRV